MKKFKRIITLVISMVMVLSGTISALANTDSNTVINQEVKEVQEFMNKQQIILTLKEQTQTFLVPLSTGETATVTIKLTKASPTYRSDIYVAKLGDWNIDYDATLPHSGSIKLRASFKVTHVPDMNSSGLDWAKFYVTGSSISAVPPQASKIADKGSSYKTVMTNAEYEITGYVSFDVTGGATMNYYVSMLMYSPGNSGDNRDKIYVDTSLSV